MNQYFHKEVQNCRWIMSKKLSCAILCLRFIVVHRLGHANFSWPNNPIMEHVSRLHHRTKESTSVMLLIIYIISHLDISLKQKSNTSEKSLKMILEIDTKLSQQYQSFINNQNTIPTAYNTHKRNNLIVLITMLNKNDEVNFTLWSKSKCTLLRNATIFNTRVFFEQKTTTELTPPYTK